MKISARILILSARQYELKDKDTGKTISGVSVHYIGQDASTTGDLLGSEPVKGTLPYEAFRDLSAVPGFYDTDFEQSASKGASGQLLAVLKPVAIRYLGALLFAPDPSAPVLRVPAPKI